MIDFTGGQPRPAELGQLGAGQMLVMRDGTHAAGTLRQHDRRRHAALGQRGRRSVSSSPIRDVSRVYLNPGSARTVFNYTGTQATAVATTGQMPGVQVRVDAKQAWTDTGSHRQRRRSRRVPRQRPDCVRPQRRPDLRSERQPGGAARQLSRSDACRSARSSARSATARRSRIGMQTQPLADAGVRPPDARRQRQRAGRQQRLLYGDGHEAVGQT